MAKIFARDEKFFAPRSQGNPRCSVNRYLKRKPNSVFGIKGAKRGARGAKTGSGWRQDVPKSPPRRIKRFPRARQDAPRSSKTFPKRFQEAPRRFQDLKDAARWPQHGFTWRQAGSGRPQDGPLGPILAHLGSILLPSHSCELTFFVGKTYDCVIYNIFT